MKNNVWSARVRLWVCHITWAHNHAKFEADFLTSSAVIGKLSSEQRGWLIKTIQHFSQKLSRHDNHRYVRVWCLVQKHGMVWLNFDLCRSQWSSFPWWFGWPWHPSSKVIRAILSTHITHTLMSDDPPELQHSFYLLPLCLIFNSSCKIPQILPKWRVYYVLFSRPFSELVIRVSPVVEVTCHVAHKDIHFKPWYESTMTVQSLPHCNDWVYCHFKTIFQLSSINMKSSVPGNHNNNLWVLPHSITTKCCAISRKYPKNNYQCKELYLQEDLNNEHAKLLPQPSVMNEQSFQDHLLSKTFLSNQKNFSPKRPKQWMCRAVFPSDTDEWFFQDHLIYKTIESTQRDLSQKRYGQWKCRTVSTSVTDEQLFQDHLLSRVEPSYWLKALFPERPEQ